MRLTWSGLKALSKDNVLELKFVRRHPKPGWKDTRRMLCTNATYILNSAPGHIALHFHPPTHPPIIFEGHYNMVCMWDLLWQEYRNVSCDCVNVITVIPVKTEEERSNFWQYFTKYLEAMSPAQKLIFMNK